jgi:hypothetical protein
MAADVELGQAVFGNPTGEYPCPAWVDALVREILRQIDRVYWNVHQREWDGEDPQIPGIEYRLLTVQVRSRTAR